MSPLSYQRFAEPEWHAHGNSQYADTTQNPVVLSHIIAAFIDISICLKSLFYVCRWSSAPTKPSQVREDNLSHKHNHGSQLYHISYN